MNKGVPHYDSLSQQQQQQQHQHQVADLSSLADSVDTESALDIGQSFDGDTEHSEEPRGRPYLPLAAYVSVVANSTNALLGVNIFAVPWGFAKSGVLGGTVISLGVAALSFSTALHMLEAQRILYMRTGEVKGYPEIAAATLGPAWSTLVQAATAISCLGGCVSFLIFLGELSGQLFNVDATTAVFLSVVPLILLSWIRSFQELTAFTVAAVVAILATIVMVVVDGQDTAAAATVRATPLFTSVLSSLNYLGPATFTFTIHYCVLSMGAEGLVVDAADTRHGHRAPGHNGHGSYPVAASVAAAAAEDGMTSSEVEMTGSSSDSGPRTPPRNHSAHAAAAASTAASATSSSSPYRHRGNGATAGTPLLANAHAHAPPPPPPLPPPLPMPMPPPMPQLSSSPYRPAHHQHQQHNQHLSAVSPLGSEKSHALAPGASSVAAQLVRGFQGVGGGTWTVARKPLPPQDISRALGASYVLTSCIVVFHGVTGYAFYRTAEVVRDRHGHPQTGCEDRVCQNIVLNLADGPVKSAIGLTLCFAIIISYVMILAPARENLESFFLRSTGVRAPWAVNLSRNVLRALLVLATALVAVVTPYFGSVLGTVGGLTDALQAFVLPPLISVHMASTHMGGSRLSPRRRIAYAAITAWGLATMVYTAVKIAKNGLDFETGADR